MITPFVVPANLALFTVVEPRLVFDRATQIWLREQTVNVGARSTIGRR